MYRESWNDKNSCLTWSKSHRLKMDFNRVKVCSNDLMCFFRFRLNFSSKSHSKYISSCDTLFRYDADLKGAAATIYFLCKCISRGKSGARHFCHSAHSNASCSISFELEAMLVAFGKRNQTSAAMIRMYDLHIWCAMLCLCFTSNNSVNCAIQCVEFHLPRHTQMMNTRQRKLYTTVAKCVAYHLGYVGKACAPRLWLQIRFH